jgi:hypothetical protein
MNNNLPLLCVNFLHWYLFVLTVRYIFTSNYCGRSHNYLVPSSTINRHSAVTDSSEMYFTYTMFLRDIPESLEWAIYRPASVMFLLALVNCRIHASWLQTARLEHMFSPGRGMHTFNTFIHSNAQFSLDSLMQRRAKCSQLYRRGMEANSVRHKECLQSIYNTVILIFHFLILSIAKTFYSQRLNESASAKICSGYKYTQCFHLLFLRLTMRK